MHIPQRSVDIPDKFKELLLPNKLQYVLSPGNIGSREVNSIINKEYNNIDIRVA